MVFMMLHRNTQSVGFHTTETPSQLPLLIYPRALRATVLTELTCCGSEPSAGAPKINATSNQYPANRILYSVNRAIRKPCIGGGVALRKRWKTGSFGGMFHGCGSRVCFGVCRCWGCVSLSSNFLRLLTWTHVKNTNPEQQSASTSIGACKFNQSCGALVDALAPKALSELRFVTCPCVQALRIEKYL